MSNAQQIYYYRKQLSDRANKLIDDIVQYTVSPTPKWAYYAGGIFDTRIVSVDASILTKSKVRVPYDTNFDPYYSPGQEDVTILDMCECDVKKISRLVYHTIRDGIFLYDVAFIDNAILLYCDNLRIPAKNPQIYEMCWYGREVYDIDRIVNKNYNFAENMSRRIVKTEEQEPSKTLEQEPSKTESDNVSGYSYFTDHLSTFSILKDYNKEKNKMVRLSVRENTDHNSFQSVTISDSQTLKHVIARLKEMETWMGEDKR